MAFWFGLRYTVNKQGKYPVGTVPKKGCIAAEKNGGGATKFAKRGTY